MKEDSSGQADEDVQKLERTHAEQTVNNVEQMKDDRLLNISVLSTVFVQRASDPSAAREQDAEAGPGGLGQREDRAAPESAGGRQQKEERAGDRKQVSLQSCSLHVSSAALRAPLVSVWLLSSHWSSFIQADQPASDGGTESGGGAAEVSSRAGVQS